MTRYMKKTEGQALLTYDRGKTISGETASISSHTRTGHPAQPTKKKSNNVVIQQSYAEREP